ncbi:MAG: hypothetical protein HFG44_04165 [Oscillospiraceae bacterium]|nr:hypothetical protein [Oscillospiraceae bacterium]
MAKRRKEYADDDGRTIANMNVEGMPWYAPNTPQSERAKAESAKEPALELSRTEKRALTAGTLKAALLVWLIGVGIFGLFILFCYFVWFR